MFGKMPYNISGFWRGWG